MVLEEEVGIHPGVLGQVAVRVEGALGTMPVCTDSLAVGLVLREVRLRGAARVGFLASGGGPGRGLGFALPRGLAVLPRRVVALAQEGHSVRVVLFVALPQRVVQQRVVREVSRVERRQVLEGRRYRGGRAVERGALGDATQLFARETVLQGRVVLEVIGRSDWVGVFDGGEAREAARGRE